MLGVPLNGNSSLEAQVATTATEGATITASASSHTKGAFSAGQLIASTADDSYGITVLIGGTGLTASTNERALMDIGIGASGSEVVLIPNLLCGNVEAAVSAGPGSVMYHFPIFIAKGSRLSAALQALVSADTATCQVWLHRHPIGPGAWFGSRVTAYGPDTATSSGVAHTHGNGSYAAATQIVASSTNPIKALQVGVDLGVDTTGATKRGLLRIGVNGTYIASDLPWRESTTLEAVNCSQANHILSLMRFNIPAAQVLQISAMMNAAGEARNFALYGVD